MFVECLISGGEMAWKWSANGLQMEKLGVTNRIRTTWIDGGRQMVFTQLWIDSLFGFNSNYGTSTNQANSWTNPCSSFIGSLLFDCQSPQNVGFFYTNFVWCTPLSISSLIYIRWNLILSPLRLVLYHLVISVLDNWWYYGSNSILVGSCWIQLMPKDFHLKVKSSAQRAVDQHAINGGFMRNHQL